MPYFIRKQVKNVLISNEDEDYIDERVFAHNDSELSHILATDPSRVFEVTESHANAVLRASKYYQEVSDVFIAEARQLADAAEAAGDGVQEQEDGPVVEDGPEFAGWSERAGYDGGVPAAVDGALPAADEPASAPAREQSGGAARKSRGGRGKGGRSQ